MMICPPFSGNPTLPRIVTVHVADDSVADTPCAASSLVENEHDKQKAKATKYKLIFLRININLINKAWQVASPTHTSSSFLVIKALATLGSALPLLRFMSSP